MYIYGKHVIEEALNSDTPVLELIVNENAQHDKNLRRILALAEEQNIYTSFLSKKRFFQATKNENKGSVIAKIGGLPYIGLPQILENPKDYPFIMVLDHIEDTQNFGSIMRTCKSFGVDALIYAKDRQCPVTDSVIHASAGAAFSLPLCKIPNIVQALRQLKDEGFWIYASDMLQGSALEDTTFKKPMVLVMGNENKGVSQQVKKLADHAVYIPMPGNFESLNVGIATAIMTYKASL